MIGSFSEWLNQAAASLASLPLGEAWLAAAIFGLTASIYASGIPGALIPVSFSSGMLLGGGVGAATVGAGALLGSTILYVALERLSRAALRARFERQLETADRWTRRGGLFPLVALRLVGLPHLAVTAVCALTGVGIRRYALATAVGIFPAIALSSIAGSAI
jgi:uncharacterized membrane protein YdjX (TVP38/TMEM64 family)